MSAEKDKLSKSDRIVLLIALILIIACVVIVFVVRISSSNVNNPQGEEDVPFEEALETHENYLVMEDYKTNISSELMKTREYGIYTISNFSLVYEDETTTLMAIATANSKEKVDGKPISIHFKDKDGNVIRTIGAYIPDILPGETVLIEAETNAEIIDVYTLEIGEVE